MMMFQIIAALFAIAILAIVALALFPRLNVWQFVIASAIVSISVLIAAVASASPINITRDNGGHIQLYVDQVAAYRAAGREVRITGRCDSSCTMYLALPTTCLSRRAVLGFHGPSSQLYGISLPPAQFDHWSRVMADHYPPALRPWFMNTARFETMGLIRVRGGELINNFGVKECGT